MVLMMPPGDNRLPMGDGSGKETSPRGTHSRERGDGYVIGLSLLGLILGGAVGFFMAFSTVGLLITILCTAGGVIVGGVAGALIGDALKRRMTEQHTDEDDE